MPKLSDVAERAGVTAATVSNVIRGKGGVSVETAKRVRAAIDDLGYRPNLTARALAEGGAPALALILGDITNPFYPEFALEVEKAARMNDRFLLVCNTGNDPKIRHSYIRNISGSLAEGIVIVINGYYDNDVSVFRDSRAPIVLCFAEGGEGPSEIPRVSIDFREAGAIAARHLTGLGHIDIGVLTSMISHRARFEGFDAVMAEQGLAVGSDRLRIVADTIDDGYAAALDLLTAVPRRPTALFATNDLIALGALQAAAKLGVAVPSELSVMGITGIRLGEQFRPQLTTVDICTPVVASTAIALLLELIADRNKATEAPCRIVGAPRLIIRESTARPGRVCE